MSQQAQMNMAAMGGPVGGGGGLAAQMNAGTPGSSAGGEMNHSAIMKKLNTAIYDYLLRHELYELAKSFMNKMPIDTKNDVKQSPSQRGGQQANGIDDSMDDSKDHAILNRPDDLPLPNNVFDGPFLQDWWCQFWEIHWGIRGRTTMKPNAQTYISQQRAQQKVRQGMVNGMDPNSMQNLRGYNNMMQGMNNGMAMGMGPNDMKRVAMQNANRNLTPQMQQQMKNMQQNAQNMQGAGMERQGSQMDMSGPRSGSPGSGDAPSPKRQRLEGNMQQLNQGRPGQPGQIQGNQVGPPSSEPLPPPSPGKIERTKDILRARNINPDNIAHEQFLNLVRQNSNVQTQTVEIYSQSMQQSAQQAMNNVINSNVNKGMNPNMGPGGAQGSPMSQPGIDAATGEFYAAATNGRIPMPQGAGGAAAGQAGNSNGNHALQDYQMQLMLLEQQNKKRLLMARQEQDSMAHPAGVNPNAQFAPGMSPQGSQGGGDPSRNPNDLQRSRGSPTPGGMMDPNQVPPGLRQQMIMGPNGPLRPPSSHPMGGMTQQQAEMMRAQGVQMPNGQFPPGQAQAQMMAAQQQGPGGQQGQPMGTPRQQNNNMPPPPAPAANAGGTNPSSPSQQPAPPTPNQNSKAKAPTKKEAAKKAAANKKGGNTGATPASEAEQPPTPTPPTPATPMHANSFATKQNAQLPNGAPVAAPNAQPNPAQQNPAQQNAAPNPNAVQQPAPPGADLPFGNMTMDDNNFGSLGLDFPLDDNALDNFDFDSFLTNGDDGFNFDANLAFDGNEALSLEGTN